jgi:hypothetical protein
MCTIKSLPKGIQFEVIIAERNKQTEWAKKEGKRPGKGKKVGDEAKTAGKFSEG